jgi:transcriptional regulator with XRE-family HTH domain
VEFGVNMPPRYPTALSKKPTTSNLPGENLGERIRALRKAAGLTLDDVAGRSGISRAALSKIERGEMSPTYESLLKVGRGLQADLAVLVSKPATRAIDGFVVTRKAEGTKYRQAQFTHELLAPNFRHRKLHAFITDVPAVSLSDYGPWHSHESEDFLYVLAGAVMLHLADHEPVELKSGDSVQMDGRIAHAVIAKANRTKAPARLLWVSIPSSQG